MKGQSDYDLKGKRERFASEYFVCLYVCVHLQLWPYEEGHSHIMALLGVPELSPTCGVPQKALHFRVF